MSTICGELFSRIQTLFTLQGKGLPSGPLQLRSGLAETPAGAFLRLGPLLRSWSIVALPLR